MLAFGVLLLSPAFSPMEAPLAASAPTAGAPVLRLTEPFPHGYIEGTLAPTHRLTATVVVANGGAVPADFLLTGVDGYTSPSSGVVFGNRAVPFRTGPDGEHRAGRWVSLSAAHVTLAPGASQPIVVTATVPAGTPPGDWVGGITAENPQVSAAGGSGPRLGITEATETAVVIHVPGPTTLGAMDIGQPVIRNVVAQQLLDIPLTYTGDLLTKPLFSFLMKNSAGTVVYSHSGRFDTFVPHATITYQVHLDPALQPGTYSFDASGGPDGSVRSSHYSVVISGAPVPLPGHHAGTAPGTRRDLTTLLRVAVGVLLVLVLGAVVAVLRRRRCSHCHRRRLGGLLTVSDFHEIDRCPACRRRALDRQDVILCPGCYRRHVLPTASTNEGALHEAHQAHGEAVTVRPRRKAGT